MLTDDSTNDGDSSKVSTPQRYNGNDGSRDVVKKRRSAVFLTEPYNVSSGEFSIIGGLTTVACTSYYYYYRFFTCTLKYPRAW